ncbi:MAG: hypothetical protein QNJ30_00540 [Kiloniellales bacterium]|nr:hypothetical protein [Kiloniellales bacterium]
MFWNRAKSPIDEETEDWLIECWSWLLANLIGLEQLRELPLVLPTPEFFPPSDAVGHDRADHVFRSVAAWSWTQDWPFVLVPQEEGFNPVLGPMAVVQNVESEPAGTFFLGPGEPMRITYDPALLDRPMSLVATFIHEIAHAILLGIGKDVPGGPEFEEWATDLTTVFLGFGIFGANCAVEFQQFHDVGGGAQGWSLRRSGYLSESEWAFALALFLSSRGESMEAAAPWLKPTPLTLLKKSLRYFERYPERLAALGR